MKMKPIKLSHVTILIPLLFVLTINNLSFAYQEVSGTISASSTYGSYAASNAADNNQSTAWLSGTQVNITAQWLQYQLSSGTVLNKYRICAVGNYAPKAWSFQGSNNGTSWTTLDSQSTNIAWSSGEWRGYAFANTTSYIYYRINITQVFEDQYGNSYAGIWEFKLYTLSSGCDEELTGTLSNGAYSIAGNMCTYNTTTINSGSYVTISATDVITLSPGFQATSGSTCDIFSGDTDHDGLFDDWEYQYFGSLSRNANNDYDGDGTLNYLEYLNGSNPATTIDTDDDGLPDWYEMQQYGNLTTIEEDTGADCN